MCLYHIVILHRMLLTWIGLTPSVKCSAYIRAKFSYVCIQQETPAKIQLGECYKVDNSKTSSHRA